MKKENALIDIFFKNEATLKALIDDVYQRHIQLGTTKEEFIADTIKSMEGWVKPSDISNQYKNKIGFPSYDYSKKKNFTLKSKSPENMKYLICNILELKVAYNELKKCIYVNEKRIEDAITSKISNAARVYDLDCNYNFIHDTLLEVAKENSYHPTKDFILSNKWDGQERIEKLFSQIELNEELSEKKFSLSLFKKFLVGVVTKIFEPGCQILLSCYRALKVVKNLDSLTQYLHHLMRALQKVLSTLLIKTIVCIILIIISSLLKS